MKRVLCVLIILLTCFAVQAEKKDAKSKHASDYKALNMLVDAGNYDLALNTVNQKLKEDPADLKFQTIKVRALMGLDRYMDAARIAMPLIGKSHGAPYPRYLAGKCAFKLGMLPQAKKVWAPLCQRSDDWASIGCTLSADALLAMGKEEEAKTLVEEALKRLKNPMPLLVREELSLNPDVETAKKLIASLEESTPKYADTWKGMEAIYAMAKGKELFRENPLKKNPGLIEMRERTERVEVPMWTGGSGGYAGTLSSSSGSRISVPAYMGKDDKKRWMLMDSGSDTVMLTSRAVKELGYKTIATAEYIGLGCEGTKKSNWVFIEKMKVGDLTFYDVPAMVIDQETDYWEKLDGILPMHLFRHHALLYDRRHNKLELYKPGTPPGQVLEGKFYPVHSMWLDRNPFVECRIQGKPRKYCLLDTGAQPTFIAAEFAKDLGVSVKSGRYKSQMGTGLSGNFSSGTAVQVKIDIGQMQFQMPLVQVTEVGQGYPVNCYGIIGRQILDRFIIYFDYSHNVIAFKAYDR